MSRTRPLLSMLALLLAPAALGACQKDPAPQPAASAATGGAHAAAAATPGASFVKKDPAAARVKLGAGAVALDVRSPDEFAGGHLPQATNIPVGELEARAGELDALVGGDKRKPIVVYCASGNRAGKAAAALRAAGYTDVVNGGGYDDLQP